MYRSVKARVFLLMLCYIVTTKGNIDWLKSNIKSNLKEKKNIKNT